MITLREFYELLEKHDWYYMYSDEYRVWKKGEEEASTIQQIVKQSEEHRKLLEEYSKHMFSGPQWGTEKGPKPERPE